jgi:hypothetical protein
MVSIELRDHKDASTPCRGAAVNQPAPPTASRHGDELALSVIRGRERATAWPLASLRLQILAASSGGVLTHGAAHLLGRTSGRVAVHAAPNISLGKARAQAEGVSFKPDQRPQGTLMNSSLIARALQVVLFIIPASLVHAGPAEDAQAAFSRFFPAFVARNQAEVTAMFAPDAQFYGTLSTAVVTTPEGVLKYFAAALDRPDMAEAKPLQLISTALSDSVVLIAGSWKLDRTLDGKTTFGAPLRVTAVLQKRNDRWLVVQFHNSPQPAPPATQPVPSR